CRWPAAESVRRRQFAQLAGVDRCSPGPPGSPLADSASGLASRALAGSVPAPRPGAHTRSPAVGRRARGSAPASYGVTLVTAVPHELVVRAYSPKTQAVPAAIGSAATAG